MSLCAVPNTKGRRDVGDARGCWRGSSPPRCRAQASLPRPASGLRQARIGQRLVRCSADVVPTGSCAKLGRAWSVVVPPAGSCGQLIPAGVAWTASYRRAGCRGSVDAWMCGCVEGVSGRRGQSVNCRRRFEETRASEGSAVLRVRAPCLPSRDDGKGCCQSPWLQPQGGIWGLGNWIRFAERVAAVQEAAESEGELGSEADAGRRLALCSRTGRGARGQGRAVRSRLGEFVEGKRQGKASAVCCFFFFVQW